MTTPYVGRPTNRVDGIAKVTGRAKYAAEIPAEDLAYGVVVSSSVAKGQIKSIDTSRALAVSGVLQVLTHENRPHLAWFNRKYKDDDAPPGHHFRPLGDDQVRYSGQPVALVVAETFEAARCAARLVKVEYNSVAPETNLDEHLDRAYEPKRTKPGFEKPKARGDAHEALSRAPIKMSADYIAPAEHHNPMEMHASTVIWEGDGKLTIYDKTQSVLNSKQYVCNVFGLKEDDVQVMAPYVGGAFGSGLRPQYQLPLAVMASLILERSVRVVLSRQQMFTFGHRPNTKQSVQLGAEEDGALKSIIHESFAETSKFEDYTEVVVNWSGLAYKCDDVHLDYKLVPLDLATPTDMRAPGAAYGMYALESAMDELAAELKMDPLDLRLRNYVDVDQNHLGRKFSSKELRACYEQGAEKFGWSRRNPEPGSMRDGKKLIGWGMATGLWDAYQSSCSAKASFNVDGTVTVSCAITDIGTGTYTIMAQIGADAFGLPIEKVKVRLGDSTLPQAPLQGGSWTAASVGTALAAACEKVKRKIFDLAKKNASDLFAGQKVDKIAFKDGFICVKGDDSRGMEVARLLEFEGQESIEESASKKPNLLKQGIFGRNTHSAVFVEVKVDEDTGMTEVSRVVSAVAAGRILNPKTARSQILGGVVWGVGMALHEGSFLDHRIGRFMNHNYAEYHVPVAKDVDQIDVIFVPEEDGIVNPLGVKGLGEIGIVGTAAAVANAIHHATGRRVRDLPITPDKILGLS